MHYCEKLFIYSYSIKIFLATKVVGPNKGNAPWIRDGNTHFDEKNNLALADLALSFVASQPFVESVIIGPATVEQTKSGILACQKNFPQKFYKKLISSTKCTQMCALFTVQNKECVIKNLVFLFF